jgi:hypothetical protein
MKPCIQNIRTICRTRKALSSVCYSSTYDTAKLYYNPYRHPTIDSTSTGYIRKGYVLDLNNNPIKNAYIYAVTWMEGWDSDSDSDDVVSAHYTFSDENGYYQIIPYDFVGISNDSAFVYRIVASATTSEPLFTDMWSQSWPANNSWVTLEKVDYSYYGYVKNITLASGADSTFSGHYLLTVEDVTIQNNASASFYATNKVHIKPGFTAAAGSNTIIIVRILHLYVPTIIGLMNGKTVMLRMQEEQ